MTLVEGGEEAPASSPASLVTGGKANCGFGAGALSPVSMIMGAPLRGPGLCPPNGAPIIIPGPPETAPGALLG